MRQCGECRSCCEDLVIVAFDKASGTLCSHHDGKGCTIYKDRPGFCRKFDCLWLTEHPFMEESWRPDKCGFLLWEAPKSKTVVFNSVRPKANHTKDGRTAIVRFARAYQKSFVVC